MNEAAEIVPSASVVYDQVSVYPVSTLHFYAHSAPVYYFQRPHSNNGSAESNSTFNKVCVAPNLNSGRALTLRRT